MAPNDALLDVQVVDADAIAWVVDVQEEILNDDVDREHFLVVQVFD